MSLTVSCQCGTTYQLKDEYEGRQVQCPKCGAVNTATRALVLAQADPAFDRDIFLLRQKALAINEKYSVSDDKGRPVVFVERPRHVVQNTGALLAGIVAAGIVTALVLSLASAVGDTSAVGTAISVVGFIAFPVVLLAVAMALTKKRHVTFYRDERRDERLLEVLQDKKVQMIHATFTIRDAHGEPLATLSKNHFTNFFRKRWVMRAPDGGIVMVAKEDSVILALLRRFVGPLFGLLRTNFIFCRGETDATFGEFKRKFTILDRYVLDLTQDPTRQFDRRLALALGVMLDTGERR